MPFNPSAVLGFWVNKAAHAFQKQIEEQVSEYGLKWSEAIVMLMLYERPSSLVCIAKALEHAHPSVLRQIDSLEEVGFVERNAHPEDRRVKIVSLTEKGEQIARRIYKHGMEIHQKALAGFSEQKQRELMFMLRDVICNLGEDDLLPSFAKNPFQEQSPSK